MRRTPLKRKPFRKALGSPELRLLFKRTVLARGGCLMALSEGDRRLAGVAQCVERPDAGDAGSTRRPVPGTAGRASPSESACDGPLQAAHLLPKSRLRNLDFGAEVIYDPRCAVALCRRHHDLHDRHILRLPSELVPEVAWDWADEAGLTDLLYRHYPRWDDAEDAQANEREAASSS